MRTDVEVNKRDSTEQIAFPENVTRILESITDCFLVVDTDWRLIYMNAACRRVFGARGFKLDELIGKHFWSEAFPETRGTQVEDEYRRAMKERVTREFEYYFEAWQS